ncbi:hypothetical protein AN933_21880 [Mycobacterium intracellulare subsp. chimaera]|nr:hypothetical protein AN933_21880 [Mycobacterium intracellulare subsp. chimaera]
MGMTDLLARLAARRVHVLTVEVPGDWVVRAEVERSLAARGWCAAVSPADADVLAVCGDPGPQLTEVIERIWDQLPGPRVRIDVDDRRSVDSALDRAAGELLDSARHREDAHDRTQSPGVRDHGDDHGGMDDEDIHDGMDHGAMAHDGMAHGGNHGMHHGAMEMAPAGIALAEGAQDRDGLEMDVLHLHLGPLLEHWPAGLVLRCSLHGDVLAEAEAWIVDPDHVDSRHPMPTENNASLIAARQCDHVVDVLALAGWSRASATARQARDLLLGGSDAEKVQQLLEKLHGMLGRSRLLRWSLRDFAALTAQDLQRLGLPTALAGDTYDRLLTRVALARTLLREPWSATVFGVSATSIADVLPGLVRGLDVATARLVVASLGIDTGARDESNTHG